MIQAYMAVIRRYPNIIVLGIIATLFSNFGQTFFIGLYNEQFRAAFSLTNAEFGSIYSVITVCSAFLLLSMGHYIDKVYLHHYITVICVCLAVGCLLIAWSPVLAVFITGLAIVRFLGQGVMLHMASTVTARYVTEGRGKGLSLTSLGLSVGGAFFPLMATFMDARLGWHNSWLIYGCVYIAFVLPVMLKLTPKREISLPDTLDATLHPDVGVRKVLSESIFWVVITTGMVMPFLMTGIFFHQRFIMDSLGLSQTLYASTFILFGSASFIASFVAGNLVDKLGAPWMMRLFLLPFLFATVLLFIVPHPVSLCVWMVLLGVSASGFHPAQGAFLAERYGVKRLGALKSVLTSSMVLSSAVAPALFGFIIDTTGSVQIIFHTCWISIVCILILINGRMHGLAKRA